MSEMNPEQETSGRANNHPPAGQPSNATLPRLALPDWLRGSDQVNRFPYQTLSTRLPKIARQVVENTPWHVLARQRLQELIAEMPHGKLRPLQDPDAPDAPAWEHDFAPYVGLTWLEAPWFVAEMYFFRRILEATGFYQAGPGHGKDPYQSHKSPDGVIDALQGWCQTFEILCIDSRASEDHAAALAELMHTNIWGNQADRSMWPSGSSQGPKRHTTDQQADHLLVDDALASSTYLAKAAHPRRVDIILDNSGIELAYDLALVDYLLQSHLVDVVQLHVKPHPTYVSDATAQDVSDMITHLVSAQDLAVQALGNRLQAYFQQRCLWIATDYFWTSPRCGWEMPDQLVANLAQSTLLVSKGDANYRRWLGDRHWTHDAPIAEILNYLPAPWLALRVLKANVVAGLHPAQADAAGRKDPSWLFSGNWGMIQLFLPTA